MLLPDKKIQSNTAMIFVLPIKQYEHHPTCWYYAKSSFNQSGLQFSVDEIARQKAWQLGGNYSDWMNGFFTRNQVEFLGYQDIARNFEISLAESVVFEEIQQKQLLLKSTINQLKLKFQAEKPAWRFHFDWFFIKTLGWPFNRAAGQFAQNMLDELFLIEQQIGPAVQLAKNRIEQFKLDVKAKEEKVALVPRVINKALPVANAEVKRVANNKLVLDLASSGKRFDAFYEKATDKIYNLQTNQQAEIQFFSKMDDLEDFLDVFSTHKNLLPADERQFFDAACQDLLDLLLNLTMNPARRLTANSKDQIYLATSVLKFIMQGGNDGSKVLFLQEMEIIFSKTNQLSVASAYAMHGLMKNSEPIQNPQGYFNNVPNRNYS